MASKPNYNFTITGRGINEITILTPTTPNGFYSALYANQDTKTLDSLFGLKAGHRFKGKKGDLVLPDGNGIEKALDKAVGLASLGNTNVEYLMRYLVEHIKKYTIFVGFPEEELKARIKALREDEGIKDYRRKLKPEFIEQALTHEDVVYSNGRIERVRYLRRVTVGKIPVVFPRNLRKL